MQEEDVLKQHEYETVEKEDVDDGTRLLSIVHTIGLSGIADCIIMV